MIERLYQEHPREQTKWNPRSYTVSRRSYDLAAKREAMVLLLNGRVPNYVITLKYLVEMPVSQIKKLWSLHSRRLRLAGITGRAAIEITRDNRRQRPTNRVHYHIVVQDTRTRAELRKLVKGVCLCAMPPGSFQVHCKPIDDWKNFVWYFVKYRMRSNYPFRSRLGLSKFYTIGGWWANRDGTPRTRESIEEEMKRYAIARLRLKRSEEFIEIDPARGGWERPTDHDKLQAELDKQTDETLYDWFSVLQGQPALFQTQPPRWLRKTIRRELMKTEDLLDAIYLRLRNTRNPLIIFAFEIYHDHKIE